MAESALPSAPAARETGEPSAERSRLLFIDCTEPQGRPTMVNLTRIKRHVKQKHVAFSDKKDTNKSLDGTVRPQEHVTHVDEEIEGAVDLTSKRPPIPVVIRFRAKDSTEARRRTKRDVRRGKQQSQVDHQRESEPVVRDSNPRAIVGDQFQVMGNPFKGVTDLATVMRWFFYGSDAVKGRKAFQAAALIWQHQYWYWSQNHELLFDGVALYAFRKQMQIAGESIAHRYQYERQKGALIEKLKREVNTKGPRVDHPTLFVMGNLAACALQDGDPGATRAQLVALESIQAQRRVDPYEWSGFTLIDLRFALVSGQPPILSYYVPPGYRDEYYELTHQPEAGPLAERAAKLAPHSVEQNFGRIHSEQLFQRIWQLYLAWPSLVNVKKPPLGYLYDLEYRIRTVHAGILVTADSAARRCMDLLLIALQLSLWMAARFWEPVGRSVRAFVLARACRLIEATPDLMVVWTECCVEKGLLSSREAIKSPVSSLSSLIWTLATLTAFANDGQNTPVPLPALVQATNAAGIKTHNSFIQLLEQWPWLENWHARRFDGLWDEMELYREHLAASLSQPSTATVDLLMTTQSTPKKVASHQVFLGAVEFYDT